MNSRSIIAYLFAFWGLFLSPLLAQNPLEKTLVKSFNLNGKTVVKLELPTAVEVKRWNDPTARIEITIATENVSETMLKSLIVAGRYNIINHFTPTEMILTSPALQKTVKVNGQEIKEVVRYTLYVPNDVAVSQGEQFFGN
jgi:hypothetical protein